MSTPNRQRALKRIHRRSHSVNRQYAARTSETPVTPALQFPSKTTTKANWNMSFLPKGIMSKRMMYEDLTKSRNENYSISQENYRLKTRVQYLEDLLKTGSSSPRRYRKNSVV